MLVFLRALPFCSALVMGGAAVALFVWPELVWFIFLLSLVLLFLLLAKLVGGSYREVRFWLLVGIPLFHFVAAFSFFLFLEGQTLKIIASALAVFLIWIFTENLFAYIHLPAVYQVNSLEYSTLVINITSCYFFATAIFALHLFLNFSFWLLVPICFLISFCLVAGTLWICKIESTNLKLYALSGAVLLAEFFTVLFFLPSGFFPNAALVTLFFYLFLGLSRAKLLDKLSFKVLKRYLISVIILVAIIVFTARWT